MPARSKKQQMAAGAALSAKRGQTPKSKLKGASKAMAESMTEKQLHDFAATPRKSLPRKKASSSKSASAKGRKTSSSDRKRTSK